MEVWRTGSEDAPQSFWGWEAKKAEWGQALMLSWLPAWTDGRPTSPVAKVFTAVVVCIHPCQVVMSVKDAANDLLSHSVAMPTRSMSALCRLPRHSVGTFYPSPLNHSFLVLPYLSVNIKHLDDRIQELQGLTSSHHVGLLVALKEWTGKQMGTPASLLST